ncbi:T9SS type B sorting domain-containing protein [Christiangramia forsetii]|uniref:T9SS type B sorting domain-containing protein n=1 Tax=Christiangramia forsetii TaxID=411153 RepID=UPI0013053DF2|nr:T9SS type B sorting domain-containing protein [Christiangramia forsetii]
MFILFFKTFHSFSQNYEIGCFTKINKQQGNFDQQLDSGDQFGYSVDNIGDLNNDGISDIIVGAFTDDDGGANRGAVYVLFLKADDTVLKSQKISSTTGGFTGDLDDNDVFGASVSYLGDMNNDGLVEVAVGAEYDGDGGYWHGAVWILSLNTDGTVKAHSKISDFEGDFTGQFNGDVVFGTDIGNIGDLNNDGIEDIIVSARRDYDGNPGAGAIWVLFLNSDFTVNSYSKISETEGNFNVDLDSEDFFGGSIAILKDLDGDGIKEIAVGSYRDDDGGTDFGSVYILFLDSNGRVKKHKKISYTQGGGSFDLNNNAIFGKSIDGYSDIDSDGLIEILVGCARCINPETNTTTGAFYLIELNNDGTVSESFPFSYKVGGFEGELNSGDIFGISLSYLKKQDPLKVVVGASKDNEGAVWILNFDDQMEGLAINPTNSQCSGRNIGFILSGLEPNESYLLNFEHDNNSFIELEFSSDENGEYTLQNLEAGIYNNIEVRKDGCVFEFSEEFEISEEETLEPEFSVVSSDCTSLEGNSIHISNLPVNETFSIGYDYNGIPREMVQFSSDAIGEITISDVEPGEYSNFQIDYENCSNSFSIKLEVNPLGEIEPFFNFQLVSECSTADGAIEIRNLEEFENYLVSFMVDSEETIELELTSDSEGILLIENLKGAQYSNFYIEIANCNYYFDETLNLNFNGANYAVEIIQSPICSSDSEGIVKVTGFTPNSEFELFYFVNGSEKNLAIVSDLNGTITLEDLSEGEYEEVTLVADSCEILIENFTLNCSSDGDEKICYSYPKFFSPNSDGINDRWRVQITSPECNKQFNCYIFDRYGKLLTVLRGPDEEWDGNFNGVAMPSDDYWVKLDFPNESDFQPEVTHISLIR